MTRNQIRGLATSGTNYGIVIAADHAIQNMIAYVQLSVAIACPMMLVHYSY